LIAFLFIRKLGGVVLLGLGHDELMWRGNIAVTREDLRYDLVLEEQSVGSMSGSAQTHFD
jgi:hypothetical protein